MTQVKDWSDVVRTLSKAMASWTQMTSSNRSSQIRRSWSKWEIRKQSTRTTLLIQSLESWVEWLWWHLCILTFAWRWDAYLILKWIIAVRYRPALPNNSSLKKRPTRRYLETSFTAWKTSAQSSQEISWRPWLAQLRWYLSNRSKH